MIQSKTIPIGTLCRTNQHQMEIRLDPVGEDRLDFSLAGIRVCLTRAERHALIAALMGLDEEKVEQKEAA